MVRSRGSDPVVRVIGLLATVACLAGCQADTGGCCRRVEGLGSVDLTTGLRPRRLASMPTTPTTPNQLWGRLVRLTIEAQYAAEELVACPMSEREAALLLSEASAHTRMLAEYVDGVLFHVDERWCMHGWHEDVELAREFVRARERRLAAA